MARVDGDCSQWPAVSIGVGACVEGAVRGEGAADGEACGEGVQAVRKASRRACSARARPSGLGGVALGLSCLERVGVTPLGESGIDGDRTSPLRASHGLVTTGSGLNP